MALLITIAAAAGSGLAVVLHHLGKAPVGYEDTHGFHVVQQVKGSGVMRYRTPGDMPAGAIKPARAHV